MGQDKIICNRMKDFDGGWPLDAFIFTFTKICHIQFILIVLFLLNINPTNVVKSKGRLHLHHPTINGWRWCIMKTWLIYSSVKRANKTWHIKLWRNINGSPIKKLLQWTTDSSNMSEWNWKGNSYAYHRTLLIDIIFLSADEKKN